MKSKLAALLLAATSVGVGPAFFVPPAAAQADVEVSFEFFQESLSPYGEWLEVDGYGVAWRPNDVDENWAPYTDGYWAYTDAGWTWVSYEEFGSVAYHYGRWVRVEDEGWCWTPGYEWGPAWVSWRSSDDHIGWAPLPPEADWEPDRGISVWVDNSYDIGPEYYNFCDVADFGAPVIREVIIARPRNVFFFGGTVNITNISVNFGIPFCGGPRYDYISGRVRRPIPALKLVRETNITNIYNNTYINKTVNKTVIKDGARRGGFRNAVAGNQLIVGAPKVKKVQNNAILVNQVKPVRKVSKDKINRGWKNVDENQRKELKQKLAQENGGARREDKRAKPVEPADLKPVPVKGDVNAPSPVQTAGGRDRGNARDKKDKDVPAKIAPGEPKPGVVGNEKPDKADRPNRPGKPEMADTDGEKRRNREEAVTGNGNLKPFNGDRPEKKDRQADVVTPPAPNIAETPGEDRNKRDKAGRDTQEKARRAADEIQREQRQAAADRQMRKQAEDDAVNERKQKDRTPDQPRERNQQRDVAADMEQQRERAARRQEAQQAEIQQQRRQQERQQAEVNARRAQQSQAEAFQRQQQRQEMQRQQNVDRPRQVDRPPQIQRPPQVQRQPQAQQRQQFQPPPPQRQGNGGGGGGRGEGKGKKGNLTPEEAAALRGGR
jgi:hypothetical protein